MKHIKITGASQRTNVSAKNEWNAVYQCHKCGEEFAYSADFVATKEKAQEESNARFDIQQRRFCYRCGYKLTTKEPVPESAYIAALNAKIDKLENPNRDLVFEIKTLRDCINGELEITAHAEKAAEKAIHRAEKAEAERDILAERLVHAAFDKFPGRSAKDWLDWAEREAASTVK